MEKFDYGLLSKKSIELLMVNRDAYEYHKKTICKEVLKAAKELGFPIKYTELERYSSYDFEYSYFNDVMDGIHFIFEYYINNKKIQDIIDIPIYYYSCTKNSITYKMITE